MKQQTFETYPSPQIHGSMGDYPLVYRPSARWRVFLLGISLIVAGLAAAGVRHFASGHETRGRSDVIVLVCIGLAFVLVSAYVAALMLVARVTLWQDRIETRDVITTRVLFRADILGWRLLDSAKGPLHIVLVPRSPLKQLKIAKVYNFDTRFWRWIESLPDLDQEDIRTGEEEILENEELGPTPEARMKALKRAKMLSNFLAVVTGIACVWAWFDPRPYRIVIPTLIVLPWVGIIVTARSRGLFRIDSQRNDPHPSVAVPFLFPGFLLALRAATDMNLLRWQEPLYVSLGLGVLLGVAAIWADPTLATRRSTAVILFVLGMSYGFGAGMEANALADHSPTSVYQSTITDKTITNGKHVRYNLYLSPWGPRLEPDEVAVSRRFYNSVEPGNKVCVTLHPGALRVAWYTVHPCLK